MLSLFMLLWNSHIFYQDFLESTLDHNKNRLKKKENRYLSDPYVLGIKLNILNISLHFIFPISPWNKSPVYR